MVVALELYVDEISKKERSIWEGMVAHLIERLQDIPHVRIWRHFPYRPSRHVPVAVVAVDSKLGLTAAQILDRLQKKDPPIYVPAPSGYGYEEGKGFLLNPHTMLEGEERIVADRLREILMQVD